METMSIQGPQSKMGSIFRPKPKQITAISEAGGDDYQCGDRGSDGVKNSCADCHMDHIFLIVQISAIDNHAASGN